ncbi:MAG: ABC transporter permease [Oscillospiraceae bacterium]|nr:ABC transporter permease [Oscillospiraceae bacterium]MBQ6214775.1 ABC transporter permease [Oscillospiraceae bacterium]
MSALIAFLSRAIVQSIPLLFGSTGEILTEKSGNLNLGIPGIMYVGAISGVIGAFPLQQRISAGEAVSPFTVIMIPLLCCLFASLLMGLLYCFLTVTLKANQNVTGLAMTTFGLGFGNFFGGSLIKLSGSNAPAIVLTDISLIYSRSIADKNTAGPIGKLFFSYGFLAYLAIIIAVTAAYILKKTRIGLNLRAVGENPATADAAGINVNRYKYVATCVGSMTAGLGGLFYVLDYASGVWSNGGFGDRGWLAIALVIFSLWRPAVAIGASIVFGGLFILNAFIPSGTNLAIKEIYKMAPYVVTIIVLIISSMRNRKDKQPPASLGLPYFREER